MQKNIPKLRFPEFKGEWEEKRWSSLGDITSGGTPSTLIEGYWNGNISWFTPTEINSKYANTSIRKISDQGLRMSSAKLLPIGSLLLTTRATIGRVSISTSECSTNQGFQSIVPNKSNDIEFIYYYVLDNKKELLRRANGSTFLEISSNEIRKIKSFLPNLNEQQKISRFLTSIDNWIQNLKNQEKSFEKYKKGITQKIFSQEVRFKDENWKNCPTWEEKKLKDVVNFSTAQYFEVDKNHKDGYFLVDMGAITSDGKLLRKKQTKNVKGLLKIDDLVMPNRDIGHGDIIGKVALIDLNEKYVLGSNMYKLSVMKDIPKFIYFLINSTLVNREMRRRSNGTSQLQLIRKDVETVKIRMPNIVEQQKISEFLTSVDKVIESKKQQIALAENWKKGLMQRMFI